jgi:peptide/nickel transport system permease protein
MRTLRRFLSYPSNWLALCLIASLAAAALAAPRLAPQREEELWVHPGIPDAPSAEHWLGTTAQGQDVYRPFIWGTRDAFRFGLVVTGLTALVGVAVGTAAGYAGGRTNTVLMRLTDAFLAFPAIASVWLFNEVLSPAGLAIPPSLAPTVPAGPVGWRAWLLALDVSPIMLALIAFSWMPYARLINTNIQRLKQEEFVEAARAQGLSPVRLVLRHLLPNAIGPAIVIAARDVGGSVVLATAFTYIGIGYGGSEWGTLLVASRDYIIGSAGNPLRYWWTFVPITLALIVFGAGWNLLGDGLNRLLDPRASQQPTGRKRWRSRTT